MRAGSSIRIHKRMTLRKYGRSCQKYMVHLVIQDWQGTLRNAEHVLPVDQLMNITVRNRIPYAGRLSGITGNATSRTGPGETHVPGICVRRVITSCMMTTMIRIDPQVPQDFLVTIPIQSRIAPGVQLRRIGLIAPIR